MLSSSVPTCISKVPTIDESYFEVAFKVNVPVFFPVTFPLASTVAIDVSETDQLTYFFKYLVEGEE